MATIQQKKAAKITLEVLRNPIKTTKGEILRAADYSVKRSLQPSTVFNSKGFKEELASYGLTQEFITTSLVDDINAKPAKRFFELNLGAEILGMKQHDTNNGNKTLVVIIAGESAQRYAVQATQKSG